jgi:hypothetical protein
MDKLKEIVKGCGCLSIVTFADNRATQFFKKSGFNKLSTAAANKFKPKIEQYRLATLMGMDFDSEFVRGPSSSIVPKLVITPGLKPPSLGLQDD